MLEHSSGTSRLCARFAAPFDAEEQGRLTGLAHDLGKYRSPFQRRIRGSPEQVDHSTPGAFVCVKQNQVAAAFCVAGHHGGLPDGGGRGDHAGQGTFYGRMCRAMENGLEPDPEWSCEITLPNARLPAYCQKNEALTDAFFVRMLYSCLVDADFLDTEQFMAGHAPERGGGASIDVLEKRLEAYISGWFPPRGELNTKRCAILKSCLEQGEAQAPGLFTLTVPTGGGKTVASLAFALRHARTHGLRRVIYVIPYTSIIEQTADTFRDILGAENVLEHHSGVLYDNEQEATPETMRLLRATENWDMPVVVTTAVQFFESLYANRSSQCRKLHNLADSVIIFDEAQMLPIPYLRPCISAIAQLVAHYGVSAVLCTATQPALSGLFQEFLPGRQAMELCPNATAESEVFRRVSFQKAGPLSWDALAQYLNRQEQVLCIVNSRKSARAVFERLEGEGAFHLSTLMVPAHRRAVLREIRQRLKEGRPCRVVSTSLIEAGVDVDFPSVFREEAGLDSILQAAGRCNREGKRPASECIVTIFRGEDKAPPLFAIPIAAGQAAMDNHADLASQAAVTCYFQELLDLKGRAALDQKGILTTLQKGNLPFRTVAERFHLIENATRTIYVPRGEGAALTERLRQGERSRELFRKLGQYGVSVYGQHFDALYAAGDLELLDKEIAVLTNPALYSERTGLSLEADSGKGLFV
ncbi:MAG: CRISPR-associated helicase Cas3' [Oscillospiraceae bacterium]